jgi:hypothetical protein
LPHLPLVPFRFCLCILGRDPGWVLQHRTRKETESWPTGGTEHPDLGLCQGTASSSLQVDSALGRGSNWALHTLCGFGSLTLSLWNSHLPHVKDKENTRASEHCQDYTRTHRRKNLVTAKTAKVRGHQQFPQWLCAVWFQMFPL